MKKNIIITMLGAIASILSGCAALIPVHETVLRPGQQVIATNRFGTVRITYVSPRTRAYDVQNQHIVMHLRPRCQRWFGALGIDQQTMRLIIGDPAVSVFPTEGIKNFRNEKQMMKVLYSGSAINDWVYDNTGLVVGFGEYPVGSKEWDVDLYQYLINGKKPTSIPGARPSQIHLESFDPAMTRNYNAKAGIKPQDEIPPLINNPFESDATQ